MATYVHTYVGSVIECRYPYPREVDEFQEYQEVACHFLHGKDSSGEESDSRIGLSVSFSKLLGGVKIEFGNL